MVSKILNMLVNPEDNLFGTRAEDNQVEILSARRVDMEGHYAEAVEDELRRVFMALRLRSRGGSQVDSVRKMLSQSLDSKGQEDLNSPFVAADRGYGKKFSKFVRFLRPRGRFRDSGPHFRCHPFVASSLIYPLRDADEVDDEDMNAKSCTVEESDGRKSNESVIDRRQSFFVDDTARMGQACFTVSEPLRSSGTVG